MNDLPALFSDLAGAAGRLDPAALRATIHATVDDGLRAASYDSVGGRSSEPTTHVERALARKHPGQFPKDAAGAEDDAKGYWGGGKGDPSWDDLRRLDELEASYVAAVYEIATRSHSGPFPADWRTATIGHRRLVGMDAITVLENTGQRPARFVLKAGDALHDIELIARRHMRRVPDALDLLLSGDPVCLSHARIGDYERPRHGDLVICKTCRDLVAQVASPRDHHKDSDYWPSPELLREHADMERTGKRADYQRERTDWIAGYPARRGA